MVNIEKRTIYGNEEDIDYFLISTPHTEQQNFNLRQDNGRLTKKHYDSPEKTNSSNTTQHPK